MCLRQVTKVSPTAANAKIVCCGAQALEADFTGVIRQQDVRTHEIDKVGGDWPRAAGGGSVGFSTGSRIWQQWQQQAALCACSARRQPVLP
jgi:hypothetical protein